MSYETRSSVRPPLPHDRITLHLLHVGVVVFAYVFIIGVYLLSSEGDRVMSDIALLDDTANLLPAVVM